MTPQPQNYKFASCRLHYRFSIFSFARVLQDEDPLCPSNITREKGRKPPEESIRRCTAQYVCYNIQ